MLAKKIILTIFLSLLVVVGYWYYHNQTAKNIVSGVVSEPISNLESSGSRTNLLLLGMGGDGHEGGDLTDSILLVSFDLSKNTADIVPIPRDLWIPSLQAKINTAYHYGNERSDKGGVDLAKSAVAETLGLPVHYVVALDFQGFVKAIDAVGGVDVEIQNTFDDFKYPIPGKETAEPEDSRYEHIHFDAGLTHMDGTTALKFARSRHALGDEGTDFARGARQQKIILAFRNKVISLGTILSGDTITKLKDSISSSVDTDITSKEYGSFIKVFMGLGSKDNIKSIPLTDFLVNPKNTREYSGQWVLIPTPSVEDLQSYVKTQLAK